MMKYFFFLSLGLNLILVFFLIHEKNKPPLERVVFEHQSTPAEAVKTQKGPPKEIKVSITTSDQVNLDMSQKIEEAGERVQQERLEFLLDKLHLGESDLDQIEKIKSRYFKSLQKILKTEKGGELGVDQRRRWLELEAKRDQDFVALMGKAKWEKFKKFKKKYNEKKFDQQSGDNGIVVPLDI